MNVVVKLFAAARDAFETSELHVPLAAGATVADLRAELVRRAPSLDALLRHTRFAVDNEYVGDTTVLSDGADVACIPPVSGG